MYASLTQQLFALPPETVVYPGHGYSGHMSSTIGEEIRHNAKIGGQVDFEEFRGRMNAMKLAPPKRLGCLIESGDKRRVRMSKLTAKAVKEKIDQDREKVCFVDVRSEDEFRSGHVPGATCVPLDKIESGEASIPTDRLVVLGCQSGMRSARANALLRARGLTNLVEMEGGFSAWAASGYPVRRLRKAIPVMRQVLLTAGTFVFVGTLLGLVVHPGFFAIPLFMGGGLMFAGITGWCGLAFLLERMPWNRVASNAGAK